MPVYERQKSIHISLYHLSRCVMESRQSHYIEVTQLGRNFYGKENEIWADFAPVKVHIF